VSRLLTRVLVVPLALSTIFLGCKDDSSGPDGGGGHGGEGGHGGSGSSVTSVERTIGKSGGRLQTNSVSLFVPSGALTKDSTITVTELDAAAALALPETTDGIKMSGIPAKFEPHGLSFAQPADVILGYDEPTNKGEPLAVLKLDNDQDTTWEYVPGAKFESGSASFQVDGFSIYCVVADPEGVADMVYGPDSGTGGSGTGGAGPGGTGGAASGGVGGGSGGVGGGSGGTAGGGGVPNGYMDGPTWFGFGWVNTDGTSSIESDLEQVPAPNCITGTTVASPSAFAELGYNIAQPSSGGAPGAVPLEGVGLEVDVFTSSPRNMEVRLMDVSTGTSYCATRPGADTGTLAIPWDEFVPCTTGTDLLPGITPIDTISVRVLSTGMDESYQFCIERLEADIPIG
jgi:hypothetical protein